MFAVIFEVVPKQELWNQYLDLAKLLRPEIERIDGFLDNERFESLRTKGRVLSLSTWRDEKAVIRWRTLAIHHQVQEKGRFEVFEDYHLRVGEFIADSGLPPGQTLRQQRFDETEVGEAKVVTISELSPAGGKPAADDLGMPPSGAQGLLDHELYESIYTPGKLLLLGSWSDAQAAGAWRPRAPQQGELRHRQVRIIRDYGMFDRREAPQYYPDVARTSPRS
jgi:heme-degrading monooxygenase HmoA